MAVQQHVVSKASVEVEDSGSAIELVRNARLPLKPSSLGNKTTLCLYLGLYRNPTQQMEKHVSTERPRFWFSKRHLVAALAKNDVPKVQTNSNGTAHPCQLLYDANPRQTFVVARHVYSSGTALKL